MERTHLANVAGEAFDPLWTSWTSRHGAAVRGSAPGSGPAVAHHLDGLQGQLAKRGPFHPGGSKDGPDAKAPIEVRTVDAPPAADVSLIDS
jgi:hypothetical protein